MSQELEDLELGITRLKDSNRKKQRTINQIETEKSQLMEKTNYLNEKLKEAYSVYEEAGKKILRFVEENIKPARNQLSLLQNEVTTLKKRTNKHDSQINEIAGERLEKLDSEFKKLLSDLMKTIESERTQDEKKQFSEFKKELKKISSLEEGMKLQENRFDDKFAKVLKEQVDMLEHQRTELRGVIDKLGSEVEERRKQDLEVHTKGFGEQSAAIENIQKGFQESALKINKEIQEKQRSALKEDMEHFREQSRKISDLENTLDVNKKNDDKSTEEILGEISLLKQDFQKQKAGLGSLLVDWKESVSAVRKHVEEISSSLDIKIQKGQKVAIKEELDHFRQETQKITVLEKQLKETDNIANARNNDILKSISLLKTQLASHQEEAKKKMGLQGEAEASMRAGIDETISGLRKGLEEQRKTDQESNLMEFRKEFAKIASLQNDMENLEKTHVSEKMKLSDEISLLRKGFYNQETKMNHIFKQDVMALAEIRKELNKKISELREMINKESSDSAREDIKRFSEELKKLTGFEKQLETLRTGNEKTLQGISDEMNLIKNQSDSEQQKLDNLIGDYKNSIADLRSLVNEKTDSASHINQLKEQQDKIISLEKQIEELEKLRTRETGDFSGELDAMKNRTEINEQKLEAVLEEQEKRIKWVTDAVKTKSDFMSEMKQFKEHENKLATLEKQLQLMEKAYESQNGELAQDITLLKGMVESQQEDLSSLSGDEKTSMSDMRRDFEDKILSLEKKVRGVQHTDFEQELRHFREEFEKMTALEKDLENLKEGLELSKKALQDEISRSGKESTDDLVKEVARFEKDINDLQNNYFKVENRINLDSEKIKGLVEDALKDGEILKTAQDNVKKSLDSDIENTNKKLENDFFSLRKDIENITTELNVLSEKMSSEKEKVLDIEKNLNTDNTSVGQQLMQLLNRLTDIEKEFKSADMEWNRLEMKTVSKELKDIEDSKLNEKEFINEFASLKKRLGEMENLLQTKTPENMFQKDVTSLNTRINEIQNSIKLLDKSTQTEDDKLEKIIDDALNNEMFIKKAQERIRELNETQVSETSKKLHAEIDTLRSGLDESNQALNRAIQDIEAKNSQLSEKMDSNRAEIDDDLNLITDEISDSQKQMKSNLEGLITGESTKNLSKLQNDLESTYMNKKDEINTLLERFNTIKFDVEDQLGKVEGQLSNVRDQETRLRDFQDRIEKGLNLTSSQILNKKFENSKDELLAEMNNRLAAYEKRVNTFLSSQTPDTGKSDGLVKSIDEFKLTIKNQEGKIKEVQEKLALSSGTDDETLRKNLEDMKAELEMRITNKVKQNVIGQEQLSEFLNTISETKMQSAEQIRKVEEISQKFDDLERKMKDEVIAGAENEIKSNMESRMNQFTHNIKNDINLIDNKITNNAQDVDTLNQKLTDMDSTIKNISKTPDEIYDEFKRFKEYLINYINDLVYNYDSKFKTVKKDMDDSLQNIKTRGQ